MPEFVSGLVVGKFSPLHKGHELVIRAALEKCERVTLLTYSNPEFPGYELAKRKLWLEELFPSARVIGLSGVPLNSADETTQREFVVRVAREIARDEFDVVFTSEEYGPGFAAHLAKAFGKKVEHVMVDRARTLVPVSGTKIRANVHAHRTFLSPRVYADFVETVCFIGAESSGKSTLSFEAAKKFGTVHVEEYGRTLWEEQNGQLSFEDMTKIARRHTEKENEARLSANRFVFIDTSPLVTAFYSDAFFGRVDDELSRMSERRYDHLFLCGIEFPLVQDGTRQNEAFRRKQQDFYLRELSRRGWNYTVLEGDLATRLATLIKALS